MRTSSNGSRAVLGLLVCLVVVAAGLAGYISVAAYRELSSQDGLATPLPLPTVSAATPSPTAKLPATPPATPAGTIATPVAESTAAGPNPVREALKSVVQVRTDLGMGTGFLYQQDLGATFFLTNQHVVDKATSVSVIAPDGSEHTAQVVGQDANVDLAVLKVLDLTGMPPLQLGDSDRLNIGDELYVLGFALGTDLLGDPTLTRGVLSGHRVINQLPYLQTDAAMNPGNSGGPVFDASGRVVGIATWGIRDANGEPIQGINFAIPSNKADETAKRLIESSG